MKGTVSFAITVIVVLSFLVGCAPAAPTAAPTKPAVAAAATAAPPPSGATSAPAVATKPAAAAPTAAPVAKIKRGGILRDADKRTVDTLDAHIANSRRTPFITMPYDTLLSYKLKDQKAQTFEVGPSLAESYKVVDPTTFEFKLRKGVKFHDGSDFNAAIAKWNFDRAATNPKSVVKQGAPATIKDIQVVDDYTLRVALKAPTAILPLLMSNGQQYWVGMVSKEAVEKVGEDKFGTLPVGTGPMKVKEWVRDDRVVLEKFPGHWELGEDGQPLPYLDGMVSRLITDASVAVMELRSGSIETLPEMDLKDIATVKGDPQLSVDVLAGEWDTLPSFYFNPRPGTQYPFSNNKALREAAQYATDRDGMAKAFGFGVALANYYPHWFPGNVGYDETLPRREFDLTKAQQLVKDAGFPNGVDFETTVINRPADVRAVEALQAMLLKANLRMKLTMLDRVVWIEKGRAGSFETLAHNNNSIIDPQSVQTSKSDSANNWAGYSNPNVDKLWNQAGAEYDTNKRADFYKQIQKHLYEDAFHITGYKWPTLVGMSKRVNNLTTYYNYRYVWLQ